MVHIGADPSRTEWSRAHVDPFQSKAGWRSSRLDYSAEIFVSRLVSSLNLCAGDHYALCPLYRLILPPRFLRSIPIFALVVIPYRIVVFIVLDQLLYSRSTRNYEKSVVKRASLPSSLNNSTDRAARSDDTRAICTITYKSWRHTLDQRRVKFVRGSKFRTTNKKWTTFLFVANRRLAFIRIKIISNFRVKIRIRRIGEICIPKRTIIVR